MLENPFEILLRDDTTIREASALMSEMDKNKGMAGIAVVVDAQRKVQAVISDGDIRRGISRGVDLDGPVSQIMNTNPILLRHSVSGSEMYREASLAIKTRHANYRGFYTDKMVLVDEQQRFVDVRLLHELKSGGLDNKVVGIYGTGVIGLTLGCTLAKQGLTVIGYSGDQTVVDSLNQGNIPFYEAGLDSLLENMLRRKQICFESDLNKFNCDIHIITNDTPVNDEGFPDLSPLREVLEVIVQKVKKGDLVVLRSSVPLGTTRNIAIPILERSGFKIGQELFVSFAPDRTVAGVALEEVDSVPQVVGGYSRQCKQSATQLFFAYYPAQLLR